MVDDLPRPAGRGRRQDRAADRHRGGDRVRGRRASTTVVAADAIPADRLGLDIGPASVAAFARRARRGADRVLERPDGRVRAGPVRGRHPRRGRGDHQGRRLHGRRRRRLGRGGARARHPDEDGVRPHLHRRRRLAGVPRGQDPARHRGAGVAEVADRGTAPAADGRQLEDEPQPPTRPTRWCRSWRTASPRSTSPTVEVVVLPPFTDIRSVQTRGRRRQVAARLRRAGPLGPRRRRVHRRDLRRRCWPSSAARTWWSGTPSGASTTRETDELVNAKAKAALANEIAPILCIGEGLDVREAGEHVRAHAGPARRRPGRADRPSRSSRS